MIQINSLIYDSSFGPPPTVIWFLYSYLAQIHGLDDKFDITINQIGSELNEVTVKFSKNHIGINIRVGYPENFANFGDYEKNMHYLEVLHIGMTRLSQQGHIELQASHLDAIRQELIESHFDMKIVFKKFQDPKDSHKLATVIIHPKRNVFDIYLALAKNGEERCRVLIYQGKADDWYLKDLFAQGKWKKDVFVLTGKESEIEYHLHLPTCSMELKYKPGSNGKSPNFNINKVDAGQKELDEYLHSLNPAIAAVIMQSRN